jgi:hypothetical protein
MFKPQLIPDDRPLPENSQKILKRMVILFSVGAAVALTLCVLSFALVFYLLYESTAPAADQADLFMEALKAGDYTTAYALCAPELQEVVLDAEGLRETAEGEPALPEKWSYTSRSTSEESATLEGRVTLANGETRKLEIWLQKYGEKWLITRFWY